MSSKFDKETQSMARAIVVAEQAGYTFRSSDETLKQAVEEARKAVKKEAKQPPSQPICGIVSHSGTNGEPLACGYPAGHSGKHAWASLPTPGTRST